MKAGMLILKGGCNFSEVPFAIVSSTALKPFLNTYASVPDTGLLNIA
jgi:hypothetical protein